MLAVNGQAPAGDGWAVEPKLDGWRALVEITAGQVTVRTRRGRVVTEQLPELAGLADAVGVDAVLDGELVARQGRAGDFYGIAPRMAAKRGREALSFVAFDVLLLDGTSLIDWPYRQRRRMLEALELDGSSWCTVPTFDATVAEVLPVATSSGSRASSPRGSPARTSRASGHGSG